MKRYRFYSLIIATVLMLTTFFSPIVLAGNDGKEDERIREVTEAQSKITRAESVKLAVNLYEKLYGEITESAENPFQDTDDLYAQKAYDARIVNGVSSNSFLPQAPTTKQEFAVMLYRALTAGDKKYINDEKLSKKEFTDEEKIAAWADTSIRALYTLGAIQLDQAGNLQPDSLLSEGEAAAIVDKIVSYIESYHKCESLLNLKIPASDITLGTSGATIKDVKVVMEHEDGNRNGEFCQVLGAIHPVDKNAPDINFQVNLPANWNKKTLQFGGGGFNGTLITGLGGIPAQVEDIPYPLGEGYVTFGSDSGHQSDDGFDASFALNEEALNNFASDQLNKTYEVAMHLIDKYYGAKPEQRYFAGSSEGGREAITVMQKWPELYDGIIAYYPVINLMFLHLTDNEYAKALYANDGEGWLNPEKVELVNKTVYDACDGLDGVLDGIISDVEKCAETFTIDTLIEKLRCEGGEDTGNDCLSDAQINTIRVMNSPITFDFEFNNGLDTYPKSTILLGNDRSSFHLGTRPIPADPPVWIPSGDGDSYHIKAGYANIRYLITQDENVDALQFNPNDYKERIQELSELLNSNSVEIEKFKENGGKFILVTGMADVVTPYNSIQYYERLKERFGQESLDEFVRFYTIPGYGHGHGPFNASVDTLRALDEWVVNGKAPGALLAIDKNKETKGRTRPVCMYPAFPKYKGSGDVNDAANFECVLPDEK